MNSKWTIAVIRTGLCILPAAICTLCAGATTTYWQHDPATPGDWFVEANWTAGVPDSETYAYINNGGTAQIAAIGAEADCLFLGWESNESGSAHVSGTGQLSVQSSAWIGSSGTGTFTQIGGTNSVSGSLGLGRYAGSSGTYELSETGQVSVGSDEYIGLYATGRFTQTGGTHSVNDDLYLGYYSQSRGTYELSGTAELTVESSEYIGREGTGTFTQTGGTHSVGEPLYVGYKSGSEGTYKLSGTGQLSVDDEEYIGYCGTGTFTQTGGTHTVDGNLYLGDYSDSEGTYELSAAGELSVGSDEYVGHTGMGTFTHTGGIHVVRNCLYLGYSSGSEAIYELSAAGQLSVASGEYVGYGGTGTFTQTGGSNTTPYLSVNSTSRYQLSGGALAVTDSAEVTGTLDFAGGNASAVMGGLVNLGQASLTGAGSTSFTLSPDSLLIVPPGFDPAVEFGNFTNLDSIVHQRGSTLTVPAGKGFTGTGTIDDHVACQGTINAASGYQAGITFKGGLSISGNGSVDLGRVTLTIEDELSGISGSGQLSVQYEFIGRSGTGAFSQTGGTHMITRTLYLGWESGSQGAYELSDTGQLSVESSECIGYSGTGIFTQTGGTHTVGDYLYVGYKSGSLGSYELSGTAQLSVGWYEYIGGYGTATLIQTGGTHTVAGGLHIGSSSASQGTYELSGTGELLVQGAERVGSSGTGEFIQTGGTHSVDAALFLGYNSQSRGTYELSGAAELRVDSSEYVGFQGTGKFTQTGGIHTVKTDFYLGYSGGSQGTYGLSGDGELSVGRKECIGWNGTATFTQTGGTHTVGYVLYVGQYSPSLGTYKLSGSGKLSVAGEEYIGWNGTGTFIQTGGSNTTNYLSVGSTSRYELSGGTLTVTDSAEVTGTLDFVEGDASVVMGGLVNLADAGLAGAGSTSFTLSPDSLLIVPGGFDPVVDFGAFSNPDNSIVHQRGSTLTVPTGKGFTGTGTIEDHVVCQGTINAASGYQAGITFAGGLSISDNGSVDLGSRTLTVEQNRFGISGSGRLSVWSEYIGYSGTGTFSQTGGTHTLVSALYFGLESGSQGTYELSGTGELRVAGDEYIAYYGTGRFIQTGGTHAADRYLDLARETGSRGTYELSGTGRLSVGYSLHLGRASGSEGTYELSDTGQLSVEWGECIGLYGTGRFTQTGGTHTVGQDLCLGCYKGSSGTYVISAGQLSVGSIRLARRSGSSGTLEIAGPEADISVSETLAFGPGSSTLTAVPGSIIHLTGAALENESTDPAALAGLGNLTLIFEGGEEDIDPVEVAGEDMGAVLAGFEENFALGTLQLGGAEIGKIRLVDEFDNRPDWDGSEALYVWNLDVGPGSYLDLNELNLYYLHGRIDPTATIDGGSPTLVPEPSTLMLCLPGILLVIAYILRRRV